MIAPMKATVGAILASALSLGAAAAPTIPSQQVLPGGLNAASVSADTVAVINSYTSKLTRIYLGGRPVPQRLDASSATDSTSALATTNATPLAQSVAAGGDKIKNAEVSATILSSTVTAGSETVLVDMTTTLYIEPDGQGSPTVSTWSDQHEIKISGKFLLSDRTLIEPSSDEIPPDDNTVAPDPEPTDTAVDSPVAAPPAQSDTAIPANLASTLSADTATVTKGFPAQNNISPVNFSTYALTWTSGNKSGDKKANFNPKYPFFGNNCSNFASQVLDAGGWYTTSGNSLQQNTNSKWTYNLLGVKGATRTWYKAAFLYVFANNTGTYGYLDNIWKARSGDLLFTDWDPNGKPDGSIDHVMVVTGVTANGHPRVSQKSSNRSNITLDTSIALAKQQGKNVTWFGLKHK